MKFNVGIMLPNASPPGVVLIVDDDEDIREILTELLDKEGYPVATAANGVQGVEYIENHDPPALVLLDIMMPMMNGWEFLELRKTHEKLAATPVVVMSANLELIKQSSIPDLDRIAKPFDMGRLLRLVAKWVRGGPPSSSVIPQADSSNPPTTTPVK